MNNKEFEQHFVNAVQKLGITDYRDKSFIIEPVFEKDRWTSNAFDDIMRLQVIPKIMKVTFDTAVKIFTLKEGYYPCWIEISVTNDVIYLKTSLRMRKAETKDDEFLYPFRIITEN